MKLALSVGTIWKGKLFLYPCEGCKEGMDERIRGQGGAVLVYNDAHGSNWHVLRVLP